MFLRKIKIKIKNIFLRFLSIENNNQYIEKLKKRGLVVGKNFNIQKDVILDDIQLVIMLQWRQEFMFYVMMLVPNIF